MSKTNRARKRGGGKHGGRQRKKRSRDKPCGLPNLQKEKGVVGRLETDANARNWKRKNNCGRKGLPFCQGKKKKKGIVLRGIGRKTFSREESIGDHGMSGNYF